MGVIKRGILGGVSGRVGNIVGSSWKGIAYLKSLPLSVANPRTTGQIIARSAMTYITQNFSPFLTVLIQPLWNRWAVQMSGFNHFVQTNVRLFADGVLEDPSLFKLSIGKLIGFVNLTMVADRSANTITLSFTNNSGTGNATPSDKVYAMFYNEDLDAWTGNATADSRNDAMAQFVLPTGWLVGHTIHAYPTFRSQDGYLVADSAYITGAIVA